MNSKIKLALLTLKNKEKGFTTVLALTCGLVATAVAVTMIAKGQSGQVNAMSQQRTSQVSAIADVGVTRTQSLFLQIPELATTEFADWQSKITEITPSYAINSCGTVNITQAVTTVIDFTKPNDYISVGNGKGGFRIRDYTVNGTQGTLTLDAITSNSSNKGQTAIKVTIPLDNTNPLGANPPGLWVSTFDSDKDISTSAEYVDANVVTRDCSMSGSGFDISKNLAAGKIAIAAPKVPFPPLPDLPTSVIKQVTDLDNLAATCPSTTKLASNPEEANWIAQVYQNLQNLVIAPANAATTTTTLTVNSNGTVDTAKYNIASSNPVTIAPANGTLSAIKGSGSNEYYTYTPKTNLTFVNGKATDTFTFKLNNGNFIAVNVTINEVVATPTAVNDNASLNLPTTSVANINVLANDTNATGATVTFTNPSKGTVTKNTDNTFNYNYTGSTTITAATTDSFTYTLTKNSLTSTGTVTVTINAPVANTNPSAANDTATVNLPTMSTTIDALANDTNATGATVALVGNGNLTNGSVSYDATNKVFTYTVANGKKNTSTVLTDTFTYTLTKNSITSTGTVNVTINPESTAGGGGSNKTVTLPGPCAEYAYNSATDTYDFLVSDIEMKGQDDLKVDLTGAAGGGKAVRIFVQGNISFIGNADATGGTNTLQIYGSNAAGVNVPAVNYALPGDTNTYTTTIVEFKGTAAGSGFLYAPAAAGSVAGGGTVKDGIWTGTLWLNTWKAQSNNAKAIVTEGNFNWSFFPPALQTALQGKFVTSGVKSGLISYEKVEFQP